jgi:hypothetical protein
MPTRRSPFTNEGAKAKAFHLLAQGFRIGVVAKIVGFNRVTVRLWRDSPEGRQYMAEQRAKYESALEAGREDARRILMAATVDSANKLASKIHSPIPFEGIKAAAEVLDRTGVIRAARVEMGNGASIDLSRLTPEQAATFNELVEIASAPDVARVPDPSLPATTDPESP